jgi:hypothetical protein
LDKNFKPLDGLNDNAVFNGTNIIALWLLHKKEMTSTLMVKQDSLEPFFL